jgi:hypothetical protein
MKVKKRCEVRNEDRYRSDVKRRKDEVSAKTSLPPYG